MTQQDGGRRREMREFDRDAEVCVLEETFQSVYGGSGVMDVRDGGSQTDPLPIIHLSRCLFLLEKVAKSSGSECRGVEAKRVAKTQRLRTALHRERVRQVVGFVRCFGASVSIL